MTGWALAATIIIAAAVGSLTAIIVDWVRQESRTWDADRARMNAEVDAQRHRVGVHRFVNGHCATCGLRSDFERRTL